MISRSDSEQMEVSVILPTYNRASFLPEAVRAICEQTCERWELIVVDDGSTDGTREVVDQLISEIPQPVRYVFQENRGAYGARNRGLDDAAGKYIAFYDSDDVWLPHHLEDCVRGLNENPSVDWVYGACRIVDHVSGAVLAPSTFYVEGQPRPFTKLQNASVGDVHVIDDPHAVSCQIQHGLYAGLQNSVIRRQVFDDYRFEERGRNEAEDQVIVIQSLARGRRLAWIDNVHVIYHVHDANSSASSTDTDLERKLRVYHAQAAGFERLLAEDELSPRDRGALKKSIAEQYFWQLGYSLYLNNGRYADAMSMFRRGLRYRPFDLHFWKTYLVSSIRRSLQRC